MSDPAPEYVAGYMSYIDEDPHSPDRDAYRCLDANGEEHYHGPERPSAQMWVDSEEEFVRIRDILRFRPQPGFSVNLQATTIGSSARVDAGVLVCSVAIPWFEIVRAIRDDPNFLFQFVDHPRRFEEFIAATYARAGWPEVVLTPRSGDLGRDIIVTKPGFGSIRFFDQVKAYSPSRLVTAEHVRAMLGVLTREPNVSKGVITTTSSFAPGVQSEFTTFLPHRIELKDGEMLRQWLLNVAGLVKLGEHEDSLHLRPAVSLCASPALVARSVRQGAHDDAWQGHRRGLGRRPRQTRQP